MTTFPFKPGPQREAPSTGIERSFAVLECMRRARLAFENQVCETSATRDAKVLDDLRLDSMFEFAEFFFTLKAMSLNGPDDVGILAELHNQRVADLLKDDAAMRRRGLNKDRLLKAIFTADVRPRLEQIWREAPGSLDQSNLSRFLVTQMSGETVRKLVMASEAAGYMIRTEHPFKVMLVTSTGIMESILDACLREMRAKIIAT